jgi:hypothetical protein
MKTLLSLTLGLLFFIPHTGHAARIDVNALCKSKTDVYKVSCVRDALRKNLKLRRSNVPKRGRSRALNATRQFRETRGKFIAEIASGTRENKGRKSFKTRATKVKYLSREARRKLRGKAAINRDTSVREKARRERVEKRRKRVHRR